MRPNELQKGERERSVNVILNGTYRTPPDFWVRISECLPHHRSGLGLKKRPKILDRSTAHLGVWMIDIWRNHRPHGPIAVTPNGRVDRGDKDAGMLTGGEKRAD